MKLDEMKNGGTHDAEKNLPPKLTELPFEEAFELTGYGRFNKLVMITCGLILLNVTMESIGMSYVVTAAQCQLNLTSQYKGLVTAAAFIGVVSSSLMWGYLGDRYGRRRVMLPGILISAALSIASSFSVNVWMLLILRILTGFFISASSATVYAYLGELHITSKRSSAIAWSSSFISLTFIILPALAWLIIPGTWSLHILSLVIRPWQVLMWWWCLPGLCAAAILTVLPESPRFVLVSRSPEEALPILAKMYAWNSGDKAENFQVHKITYEAMRPGGFAAALKNVSLMFRPPLLKAVVISHLSMFSVFMLSSGIYLWVPDILNSMLENKNLGSLSICDIIHKKFEAKKNATLDNMTTCHVDISVGVFPISMGMGVLFGLVYLSIGFLINFVGRVRLFFGIMMLCGVMTAGAGLVPHSGVAIGMLHVALCSGCAASILAAIVVDVIPTSMRAMAMCVMYMVGRTGAAVGAYVLGATLDNYCQLAFVAIGILVIGTTLMILWWPNTEKLRKEMENKGLSY